MSSEKNLQSINGQKIRRQYFNGILCFATVCVVPFALITYLMNLISGKEGAILQQFSDVVSMFLGLLILLIPIIILSVLNRSLFGEVICVLEKEGLHHKEGFLIWEAIVKMEFELNIPSKDRKYFCSVNITKHSRFGTEIHHAPYYLLKEAKNYRPDIQIGLGQRSKFLIRFFLTVLILMIVAYNIMM